MFNVSAALSSKPGRRIADDAVWPSTLMKTRVGEYFDEEGIDGVVWPDRVGQSRRSASSTVVDSAEYGDGFNQPIAAVAVWPRFPDKLDLGITFNQPIAEVVWPASLRELLLYVSGGSLQTKHRRR